MKISKFKLGFVVLLIAGLIVLAGCSSSNSQYPRYQQQAGAPQAVGGGCGVTAPSDNADPAAFAGAVDDNNDAAL